MTANMPAHKLWKFHATEVDEWVRAGKAAVLQKPL